VLLTIKQKLIDFVNITYHKLLIPPKKENDKKDNLNAMRKQIAQ